MLGEVLTAILTPFHEDGSINVEKFKELANHLVDNGSDGVVVAGTTGESPTLSDGEKLMLFAAAKELGIKLDYGWFLGLIGALGILTGGLLRQAIGNRARKPPGVI